MLIFSCIITGINHYLNGFIPAENLRFRTTSLDFRVAQTATKDDNKRNIGYVYLAMVKQLGILKK